MSKPTSELNESLKIPRTIELPNGAVITISCTGFDNLKDWSREQLCDAVAAWAKNSAEIFDGLDLALIKTTESLMEKMAVPLTNLIGKEASDYLVGYFNSGKVNNVLEPFIINSHGDNDPSKIQTLLGYINKAIEYGYIREEIFVWNENGRYNKFGTREEWQKCIQEALDLNKPFNPLTGNDIKVDDSNPAPSSEDRIVEAMQELMISMYYVTDKYLKMFEGL